MSIKLLRNQLSVALIAACAAVAILGIPLAMAAGRAATPLPEKAEGPSVDIVAPVGGEDLIAGEMYTIRWTQHGCEGTVTLWLWDGVRGTWSTIASAIPVGVGRYQWTVSPDLIGHRFRIRLVFDQTPTSYWLSDDFFTVQAVYNESWQVASSQDQRNDVADGGLVLSTLQCFPTISDGRVRCSWTGSDAPTDISVWTLTGSRIASFDMNVAGDLIEISTDSWTSGIYTVVARFPDGHRAMDRVIVRR